MLDDDMLKRLEWRDSGYVSSGASGLCSTFGCDEVEVAMKLLNVLHPTLFHFVGFVQVHLLPYRVDTELRDHPHRLL